MKRFRFRIFLATLVVMFLSVVYHGYSQGNVAEQAYQVFQAHCMACHGDQGTHKEILRIDRESLIESQTVIPGAVLASDFYRRLT